jgi:hypothetical protein
MRQKEEFFAFVFDGYLNVPKSGVYTLYLLSDDGSKVVIGDRTIVDNDGLHSAEEEKEGSIALERGLHAITIQHFQREGDKSLLLRISGPDLTKQEIPATMFVRSER